MWITEKVKGFLLWLLAVISAVLGVLAVFLRIKLLRTERDYERELRKRQEETIKRVKENLIKKARVEKENREIDLETHERIKDIDKGKGLLDRLNRIFPALILIFTLSCAQKEFIYVEPIYPSLPPEPLYFPVKWQERDGLYCLDEENARNLLKNIELMRGYQKKLRNILEEYGEKPKS